MAAINFQYNEEKWLSHSEWKTKNQKQSARKINLYI
jgi:hypothetical protein